MAPRNSQACLLGLPAELRNRIFLEVALSASLKTNGDRNPINIANPGPAQKTLFRSFYLNKQLFHELKTLFYGNILFIFTAKEVCVAEKVRPLSKSKDQAIKFADVLLAKRTLSQLCAAFSDDHHIAYTMDDFGWFWEMKLLHTDIRRTLRHVRLDIEVPLGATDQRVFDEDIFNGHANDWLYPVRALKAIGLMTTVKTVEVVVSYNVARLPLWFEFPKSHTVIGVEIEDWVKQEIKGIKVGGIEMAVRFSKFSRAE